jgi:hypothetical protein
LLALLASNSGEGFPKVGIGASRIAKGMIKDRFHLLSRSRGCVIPMFLPLLEARRVPGRRKSRWFSGLRTRLFSCKRATVKSLDIDSLSSATTPCNAHAPETIRRGSSSHRPNLLWDRSPQSRSPVDNNAFVPKKLPLVPRSSARVARGTIMGSVTESPDRQAAAYLKPTRGPGTIARSGVHVVL